MADAAGSVAPPRRATRTMGDITMRRRTIGLTATLLAALLLGGAAHAADARVTIDNFSFSPATMTVERDAAVTWANPRRHSAHGDRCGQPARLQVGAARYR